MAENSLKLTSDNEEECKKIFETIDEQKTGRIPIDEMKNGLRVMGLDFSEDQFNEFIKDFPADSNRTINFETFCSIMAAAMKMTGDKKVKDAFLAFDQNSTGVINSSELGPIMETIGITVSPEEMHGIIQHMDPQNTGKIKYNDIIQLIKVETKLVYKKQEQPKE